MEALPKMKAKFLVLLLPLIVFASGAVFATGLTLDHVDGLYATDTIQVGQPVTFWIRITNGDTAHGGITNGFRVYSPDGAEWGATVPDTVALNWASMFSLVFAIKSVDVDGVASDTVGFGGSYNPLSSVGIPANFDSVSYSITIGPIDAQYHGKTIVLDSSFYPGIGSWKWAGPDAYPTWGGPYTFTIFDPALDVTTDPGSGLPTRFALNQNYPNPFNPTTQIKFDLPTRSKVSIDVYNVLGQKVKTLVNDEMAAGSYIADWDGTSDGGKTVSSGVYFYRMQAGKFQETKKMMLLK
jgi:hypothetical protein